MGAMDASRLKLNIFMPLAPGSRLGPYEILSPIGAGGMGEVGLVPLRVRIFAAEASTRTAAKE